MIIVSTKKRTAEAVTMMTIALHSAMDEIKKSCFVEFPGYSQSVNPDKANCTCCDICPAKQGCRDITRAALYAQHKFEEMSLR